MLGTTALCAIYSVLKLIVFDVFPTDFDTVKQRCHMRRYNNMMSAYILFFLLCSLPNAYSQDVLKKISETKIIRFGTTGDYKPFSYYNQEKNEYNGIDIDLINDLAKKLDAKVQIYKTSWPTLMDDYKSGKFDIAMSGISKTEERQKQALFSIGYMKDGKTAVALCKNKRKYKTFADIDKQEIVVAVNPGGTNNKFVIANIKNATVVTYKDNNSIFDEIIKGNADVMFTDAVEAKLQHKLKPTLCVMIPVIKSTNNEIVALLTKDAEWKEYVDKWLSKLIQTKKLKKIIENHL